jgi:hypothetical protein
VQKNFINLVDFIPKPKTEIFKKLGKGAMSRIMSKLENVLAD